MCASEDMFNIWNFDTDSELCGGQILKPRVFPFFVYDEHQKKFKSSGSRVIDNDLEVGGVDTCQVDLHIILKALFNFIKGDSGGPVVKYLPVKSQGKKTYRAHLIGKTLTSQKWLTVVIFLKWQDCHCGTRWT